MYDAFLNKTIEYRKRMLLVFRFIIIKACKNGIAIQILAQKN